MRTAAFVLLTAMTALLAGCEPRPKLPLPPNEGKTLATDLKEVAGEWKVVSFESPDHDTIRPETIDKIKKLTFKVEGNLARVRMPDVAREMTLLLRVDQSVSPRALDIIAADARGKPLMGHSKVGTGPTEEVESPPLMCIYKLDGNKLTVATTDFRSGLYRPREFKAATVKNDGGLIGRVIAPDCRVVVLHLERAK